ncbi:MAG: trypsin-like peptidase domain-containing protein [Planctomycetaceae bacterium]|nr:trypsin-like peptidase domain-containing protein [Planctomycetaceae bacterium]
MRPISAILITLLLGSAAALAQDPPAPSADPWESAAKKLQEATVTVRILTAKSSNPSADPVSDKDAASAADTATVCSGVCVRDGQIVTAAMAGTDSSIRLTIAGGKQAQAELQVIDEFSGLALLKCQGSPAKPLEFAAETPAVGGGVMTASGWGVELPLVSLGIVAGTERQRQGANYPPLIQCDLRTTDTSSGAGVVDRHGKLVGLIVAADSPESRRGWAYAVPVSHVERLLRTAEAQKQAGVTIIKRRRPVAGLELDQTDDQIVVKRVFAGGAAEKAGIMVGDVVLATEGVAIRAVYQAMLPTLYKQPGDTMTFRIQRNAKVSDIQVVLGGGVEVSSAPLEMLSGLMQPRVQVVKEAGGYVARRPGDTVREVFQPALPADEAAPAAATPAQKIALLEKALDRYRSVIEFQQRQLKIEEKQRQAQDEQLRSLRDEIQTLRRQLIVPSAPKAP